MFKKAYCGFILPFKHEVWILCLALLLISTLALSGQDLYFPPRAGQQWATQTPDELKWCTERLDELYDFLARHNTKALLVLKDGRMVIEKYFGTFTADSTWYWASAGKTLTAMAIGIAQQEGRLSLSDPTSKYLGQGWTSLTPQQEEKITVWHQLTMTSGLEDRVPNNFCTRDTCLIYRADAGTVWAYHNAPYTLLDQVIEGATGQNLNVYLQQKIKAPTGMTGLFVKIGFNNIYFSTARSMARFGILALNRGNWDQTVVLSDGTYFDAMVNSSQMLNPSYGYLWWLNGKSTIMYPNVRTMLPGPLSPHAPADMIAALGANGQILGVVPSERLIVVRMGESPDAGLVPALFADSMWMKLQEVICLQTSAGYSSSIDHGLLIHPNPTTGPATIRWVDRPFELSIYNLQGQCIQRLMGCYDTRAIDLTAMPPGLYLVEAHDGTHRLRKKLLRL